MIAGLFMMIWGIFFAGVPTIAIFSMIGEGGFSIFMAPIFLFVIVGVAIFVAGVKKIIKKLKLIRIKTTGQETTGYYIDMNSNTRINGIAYYYIVFAFKNNTGREIHVKTPSEYTFDEAKYFANKKTFKVMFSGNTATIAETPTMINPTMYNNPNNNYNPSDTYNSHNNSPTQSQTGWSYYNGHIVNEKNYYYVCEYCGSSQKKIGKCKSCGAKITEAGKREEQ